MTNRMTISMPDEYVNEIDEIQKELKVSRSTLLRMAFETFIKEHRRSNLRKRAALMREEYLSNNELNSMKDIDGDDFETI
jgi:metal-responsive CopG/Arc/MetJ family transcriptional regulator